MWHHQVARYSNQASIKKSFDIQVKGISLSTFKSSDYLSTCVFVCCQDANSRLRPLCLSYFMWTLVPTHCLFVRTIGASTQGCDSSCLSYVKWTLVLNHRLFVKWTDTCLFLSDNEPTLVCSVSSFQGFQSIQYDSYMNICFNLLSVCQVNRHLVVFQRQWANSS